MITAIDLPTWIYVVAAVVPLVVPAGVVWAVLCAVGRGGAGR